MAICGYKSLRHGATWGKGGSMSLLFHRLHVVACKSSAFTIMLQYANFLQKFYGCLPHMSDLAGSRVTEITVNTRRLICKSGGMRSNRKAAGAVKMLKRFIQKQWSTKDAVHLSEDLNKHIWAHGDKGCVGRVRIRVERGACLVNPENKVIRLSLVEVSSFKGLNDSPVNE